jgi:GTP cyclohydrolase I
MEGNLEKIADHVKSILTLLGEDTQREGLQNTPLRYAKALTEIVNPKPFEFTTFDSEGTDEMVIVTGIPFYSLCEHHLLPFYGVGHIAYIPTDKIIGLSKLPRTLDLYASGFQNQERITKQVALRLQTELNPKGVAVTLQATHLCMCMRGVKKHDTQTTTSKMLGVFKENSNCRNEYLNLIR